MQPVTILKRALAAQRRIASEQDLLEELEGRALELFDRTASTEYVTDAGVIYYKRSTRWIPIIEMIPDARAELGLEFDSVFEAHVSRSVPESAIDALEVELGERSSEFVREDVGWRLRRSFQNLVKKEPDGALVQSAAPFFDHKVQESIKFQGVDD